MTRLTLYTRSGGCSIVPHALMHHLSIDFNNNPDVDPPNDVMDMSLPTAAINSELSRRLREQILQCPPLLCVGMYDLTEMPAILTYLAVRGGAEGELLGRNKTEKAVVMQWLSWLEAKVYSKAFRMLGAPETFSEQAASHQGICDAARSILHHAFQKINRNLVGMNHTVGGRFTVVDLNLYMFARWYKELWPNMNFDTRFPEWYRVMKEVEALDGVVRAVNEQGIRLLFQ